MSLPSTLTPHRARQLRDVIETYTGQNAPFYASYVLARPVRPDLSDITYAEEARLRRLAYTAGARTEAQRIADEQARVDALTPDQRLEEARAWLD